MLDRLSTGCAEFKKVISKFQRIVGSVGYHQSPSETPAAHRAYKNPKDERGPVRKRAEDPEIAAGNSPEH